MCQVTAAVSGQFPCVIKPNIFLLHYCVHNLLHVVDIGTGAPDLSLIIPLIG